MVRRGSPRPDAQLFRPGRSAAGPAGCDREPVLSARAGVVALRACRPCHGRDRDRLPGDHFRRIFAHPAGDPARLSPAHEHYSYDPIRDRPDLCSLRELDTRDGHACGRDRLRLLGRSRWSLRHRRLAAHGDHHADGDVRRAALEVQPADRLCREWQPDCSRPPLLRIDLHEAPRRRLVSIADRAHRRVPHVDLAQGRGDHGQDPPGGAPAVKGVD